MLKDFTKEIIKLNGKLTFLKLSNYIEKTDQFVFTGLIGKKYFEVKARQTVIYNFGKFDLYDYTIVFDLKMWLLEKDQAESDSYCESFKIDVFTNNNNHINVILERIETFRRKGFLYAKHKRKNI